MPETIDRIDHLQRTQLRNVIDQSRKLLEGSVADLLQQLYGVQRNGRVMPLTPRVVGNADNDCREQVIAYLRRRESALVSTARPSWSSVDDRIAPEAVEQCIREVAFTHFNRLVAQRIMEQRGITARASAHLSGPDGLRTYLASKLDVLFSSAIPADCLSPNPTILNQTLDQIDRVGSAQIWSRDDFLSWLYQDFTSRELREQIRKDSQSGSRSTYELTLLGQYATPRYIVQFLADNSLGRIWYEMLECNSVLAEHCSYLVRHPRKITHRRRIDPRELTVLDPACGSGNFLLYCFDLLLAIYEEAWARPEGAPTWSGSGRKLHEDYPTLEELRRAAPELILRNNLYGIDIDLRATQITALALWLRAERSYQELEIETGSLPSLSPVHIVCAASMPREEDLQQELQETMCFSGYTEFLNTAQRELRQAGEIGSLLRFSNDQASELVLDNSLEVQVSERLAVFASQVAHDSRRHRFAEDVERALIYKGLCSRQYKVILTNPPFGKPSHGAKGYIDDQYRWAKHNLYAAFVERGLEFLEQGGLLGVITPRDGFFLKSFEEWRENIVLGIGRLTVVADIGTDSVREGMLATAAYCIEKV